MKTIRNSKIIKVLRNFFGYKPSLTIIDSNLNNLSTSDAFFWRTDNNFKTIFRYTDIFNFFFEDKNSEVEILFYDKNNNFLKKSIFTNLDLSNELIIDKSFMNNIEDFGTFYIFHTSSQNNQPIIRNSCYTGYSQNNHHPSFVHGNTVTALKNYNNKHLEFGISGRTFFKENTYQIQNCFKNRKIELMIVNPTNKKLKININNKIFFLESCCSVIKKFENANIIKIRSKCYLLRPIIFSYHKDYLDVYHG